MKNEPEIRTLSELARRLADNRNDALLHVPFLKEIEAAPLAIDRIALPVVAVTGSFSAGKSSLINASYGGAPILPTNVVPTTLVPVWVSYGEQRRVSVHVGNASREVRNQSEIERSITDAKSKTEYVEIETPEAKSIPWRWLDLPGSNTELQKAIAFRASARDMADACVFVTPATQPLSLGDLMQLSQLSDAFPGRTLVIAVSRGDQVPANQHAVVRSRIEQVLADALPGRNLPVFIVAHKARNTIAPLLDQLGESIVAIQRERLTEAVTSWRRTLDDLEHLLQMRDLDKLRPETIQRAGELMQKTAVQQILQLKRSLPLRAEEIIAGMALPLRRRDAHIAFRNALLEHISSASESFDQQLNGIITDVLSEDLGVESAKHMQRTFANLLSVRGDGDFVPDGVTTLALVGGALGGTGDGGALGMVVGGLLGGLVGGLIDQSMAFSSREELREQVARPFTNRAQLAADQIHVRLRSEIDLRCRLLVKGSTLFASVEQCRDVGHRLKKLARTKLKELENDIASTMQSAASSSPVTLLTQLAKIPGVQ